MASISTKQAIDQFSEHIYSTYPTDRAKHIINELITAIYRYALPIWGFRRKDPKAKMKATEKRDAEVFLETLDIVRLPELLTVLEKGFELVQAPKSSRAVYGGRGRLLLSWAQKQPWYPGKAILSQRSLENECRPKMRYGRGDWRDFALMEEKGKQLKYRIEDTDISPTLQGQLDALTPFMADPDSLDRPFVELEESTASGYHKVLLLWLGWSLYYDSPSLDPNELTLEHLVPKVSESSLESLSPKGRKAFWTKIQRELEAKINRYFEFLRTQQKSDNPRTRMQKLTTLLMVAKFLYASEVEEEEDYKGIPVIRTLQKRMQQEAEDVEQWSKDRRYVADQSRKWPEAPPGQTVLEYTQETVIEQLRLECRPRQSTGDFCKGHIIAKSHLFYLLFVDVGVLLPGRQQEPRSYRIALSCPIQRPETVPINGTYWPLPPDWSREKRRRNGSLADNYLYKVYHYDGQFYEQGVWVREKCKYKTSRHHGKRVSVIDNVVFDDGQCLYDYIERYLCGQWYSANFRDGYRYDWWDADLQGTYGKWLTQGRAEFCSTETPLFVREGKSEIWVSSYLFLNPTSGQQLRDNQMSELFARNSYRIIGKRITPHTFRYMWATWAFQMGLSDAEMESLAHGMGFTVRTLRKMYERSSPTEKNRPINKAMRKIFPWRVEQDSEPSKGDRLSQFKEALHDLSAEEVRELRQLLDSDSVA